MNAPALAQPTPFHAPTLTAANAPAAGKALTTTPGSVLLSLCFRAEDVQACGQARRWTDAAVDELLSLAELTDPRVDEEAEVTLRRAIAQDPGEVEAFAGLTSLLSRQGRHDEALEVVDQALGWCSDVPMLHFHAGQVLAAAGRTAEAVASYHRALALALEGTLPDAHYELGLLYEEMGEPRLSARHFRAYSRVLEQPVAHERLN